MLRYISKPYFFIFALLLMCPALLSAPRYARIIVGARELSASPKAIVDGDAVYAPVDLLKSLGISYAAGEHKISVALDEGSAEIDIYNKENTRMIRLDEAAKALDIDYSWDDATSTARLLSKLVDVEFDNSTLTARLTMPVSVSMARIWPPTDQAGWRVQIDLAGTRLATNTKTYSIDGSDVSQIRLGQFTDDTARIVMDVGRKMGYRVLTKGPSREIKVRLGGSGEDIIKPGETPAVPAVPVSISSIDVQPDSERKVGVRIAATGKPEFKAKLISSPPRIIVDIENATLNGPEPETRVENPLITGIRTSSTHSSVRIVCDLTRYVAFSATPDADGIFLNAYLPFGAGGKLSDKVIVIDAGHGGTDPGARAEGIKEKDLTLAIANKVKAALEEAGAKVILTRDGDYYIGLKERPAVADQNGADLFISFHCNAIGPNMLTGIETYYHPGQSSSKALAYVLQEHLVQKTGMKDRGAKLDTNIYSIGFAVLRNANVPAVLIETGFIDHAKDRSLLCDDTFRGKIAQAVVSGLRYYVEGKSTSEGN